MPHYTSQDDVFTSDPHFLSPSTSSPRKSPSRQSISNRKSTASLRGPSSLAHVIDEDAANGRHSLAHELAVALMPEPSAGSKLLAEEFGIEYDEGAEGIDEDTSHHEESTMQLSIDEAPAPSFADELNAESFASPFHSIPSEADTAPPEYDPVFESPSVARRQKKPKRPEQDPMEVLAQDLESTDKFLGHLRSLDSEGSSTSQQSTLEHIASDVIRKMNDTVRDREGQVRELLEYEREFRKISGELGGSDVLGQLDELESMEEDFSTKMKPALTRADSRRLDTLEEPRSPAPHQSAHDWELDPDRHRLGDDDDEEEDELASSPIKDSFPPPPSITGPPTPGQTIPQLAHLRSFTTSLVTSLTTISEQAQVNGAATTEAGRKIRALKNKMGGWRTDWDSAERSRLRIERWEAGITDIDGADGALTPLSPTRLSGSKRIDGRSIVQEHLKAFELALANAAIKTQAIMAR